MEIQQDTVAAQAPVDNGPTNGEVSGQASGETTQDQSLGKGDILDGKIGPDNLPPELEETRKQLLRDYHAKMQAFAKEREEKGRLSQAYESAKSDQETLQTLMQQEWFKRAVQAERENRNGPASGLTDEQFEAIKNDKNAFDKYFNDKVENLITGKIAPEIGATQGRLEELQTEREFDDVSSRYKDFSELNEKGVLDEYLEAGYDYETAYQKFKMDNVEDIESMAQKRAEEILKQSRDGAVAGRGTPQVNGQFVVKAKNFDDAFDRVADAIMRGHKDVRVERG